MQDNKDMSVWLAPVEGPRILFPVRVAVRTMIGMGELLASQWSLEGAGKGAASARRPTKADDALKAEAVQ
jgi:hypothetical protein